MPRVARVVILEIPYHVTQRGDNRQDVDFVEDDRRVCSRLKYPGCLHYMPAYKTGKFNRDWYSIELPPGKSKAIPPETVSFHYWAARTSGSAETFHSDMRVN